MQSDLSQNEIHSISFSEWEHQAPNQDPADPYESVFSTSANSQVNEIVEQPPEEAKVDAQISEDQIQAEVSRVIGNEGFGSLQAKMNYFNIAIIGEPGSGRSSLIDTLLKSFNSKKVMTSIRDNGSDPLDMPVLHEKSESEVIQETKDHCFEEVQLETENWKTYRLTSCKFPGHCRETRVTIHEVRPQDVVKLADTNLYATHYLLQAQAKEDSTKILQVQDKRLHVVLALQSLGQTTPMMREALGCLSKRKEKLIIIPIISQADKIIKDLKEVKDGFKMTLYGPSWYQSKINLDLPETHIQEHTILKEVPLVLSTPNAFLWDKQNHKRTMVRFDKRIKTHFDVMEPEFTDLKALLQYVKSTKIRDYTSMQACITSMNNEKKKTTRLTIDVGLGVISLATLLIVSELVVTAVIIRGITYVAWVSRGFLTVSLAERVYSSFSGNNEEEQNILPVEENKEGDQPGGQQEEEQKEERQAQDEDIERGEQPVAPLLTNTEPNTPLQPGADPQQQSSEENDEERDPQR